MDVIVSIGECPLSPTGKRKRNGRSPNAAISAGGKKRKSRPLKPVDHLLPQHLLPEQDLPASVWANIAMRLARHNRWAAQSLLHFASRV